MAGERLGARRVRTKEGFLVRMERSDVPRMKKTFRKWKLVRRKEGESLPFEMFAPSVKVHPKTLTHRQSGSPV